MDQGGTPAGNGTGRAADGAVTADDADVSAVTRTGQRFAAFISYAHVDEDVAAKLHKQIETYRLPKKLRGADGGEAAVRLGAVFRDRADLAAADSLNAAIRAALADSGALIVLCSPAAVQSRWVNEEIRLFRDLNPGAPVLAAVVRGEPAEAMPEALTEGGREPLAADLRDEGDGKKLGFLKIVAALAGVPLDALIQRDAQRKLRRVMAVTVGALLLLIAAVTMMTYAIQQRNEAQAQREEAERRRMQAEGLVEFMLTDLRDRLRGVGRIDIMRSAVGSALDSYGSDGGRGELGPDGQGQLARLLHAVGEDDYGADRTAEALRSFRQAQRITVALLADAPRDPDRIFNHAQSEYWLGFIAYNAGDFAQTARHWQAYRDLAVRLQAAEPGTRRTLQEVSYGEGNLCTVAHAQQQPAVEQCRLAYVAQRALSLRFPDDQAVLRSLATRAGWLADALEMRDGELAGFQLRVEQLALARRLHAIDRGNYDDRDLLVSGLYSVATAHIRGRNFDASRALLLEAQAMLGDMRERDPENRRWETFERLVTERLAQRGMINDR